MVKNYFFFKVSLIAFNNIKIESSKFCGSNDEVWSVSNLLKRGEKTFKFFLCFSKEMHKFSPAALAAQYSTKLKGTWSTYIEDGYKTLVSDSS